MDFRFTKEEEAFRKEVHDFIETECPPTLRGKDVNFFQELPNLMEWRKKIAEKGRGFADFTNYFIAGIGRYQPGHAFFPGLNQISQVTIQFSHLLIFCHGADDDSEIFRLYRLHKTK